MIVHALYIIAFIELFAVTVGVMSYRKSESETTDTHAGEVFESSPRRKVHGYFSGFV